MATRRWLGGISGDWSVAGNWSGGAVPVNNDDVIFDSGSVSVDAGLNQSAVSLNSLNITSGYKGSIGSPGASLQININGASPTAFRVAMGGQFVCWSGTSTPVVNVGSTGSGVFYITGGTLTGGLTAGSSGKVVISTGVTISGNVNSAGCGIDCASTVGSAYLMAGTHALRSTGTYVLAGANVNLGYYGSGAINTTDLMNGARLNLFTTGTLATVNAYPGSTITNGGQYDNTITTLYKWTNSVQNLRAPSAVTTVTTTTPVGEK